MQAKLERLKSICYCLAVWQERARQDLAFRQKDLPNCIQFRAVENASNRTFWNLRHAFDERCELNYPFDSIVHIFLGFSDALICGSLFRLGRRNTAPIGRVRESAPAASAATPAVPA